jgi:hypothetical protein
MSKTTLEIAKFLDYNSIKEIILDQDDIAITDVLSRLGQTGIKSKERMLWTGAIICVAMQHGYLLRKVGQNFHIYKNK